MHNQIEDGEVLGSLRAVLEVKGVVALATKEKNGWEPATGSCIEEEKHLISYADQIAIAVVKHGVVKVFAKDEGGILRSKNILVPHVQMGKTKLSEAEAVLRTTFNISEIELLRLPQVNTLKECVAIP